MTNTLSKYQNYLQYVGGVTISSILILIAYFGFTYGLEEITIISVATRIAQVLLYLFLFALLSVGIGGFITYIIILCYENNKPLLAGGLSVILAIIMYIGTILIHKLVTVGQGDLNIIITFGLTIVLMLISYKFKFVWDEIDDEVAKNKS